MKFNWKTLFKKRKKGLMRRKADQIVVLKKYNDELLLSVKPRKLSTVINKKGWAEIDKTSPDGSSFYFGWNRIFIGKWSLKTESLERCLKCNIKMNRDRMILLYYVRHTYIPKTWSGRGDEGWIVLCKKCFHPVGAVSRMLWVS